ncbi:MAG TPA: O-antigen ligase family protein [Candidatus Krumholzibacteria bacterium]|nr:O-antigen ligase family protein [Candidatus Krumholzibacteria bacterium]
MMTQRRITVASIFLVTCLLAFGVTYLLLRSTALATVAVAGFAGFIILFIEPFVGLVNYFLFLYIRPQDYVTGMIGKPIMLIIGAATFALMVLHMAVQKRSIRLAWAPQNFLMLWFFAAVIMSRVAALYIPGVTEAAVEFLAIMMMYFLIANLVSTPRRLGIVINLLVVLTIVLAAQGIVQYFTGTGFGGQETYEGRIQAVGIFSDPNDLGLALVMVLPFVFLKLMERSKPWEKLFAFVGLSVLVYALYLTQSRGGLMAFGALMMILFSRSMGKVLGYGIGGLAMLALFVLGPRMSTISTEEASAYGRIEAWGIGVDLFEQFPLFGVGYGNFTEYHFRTAHNSFVLCMAELGMFGFYAWSMLLYLSIKNAGHIANVFRRQKQHRLAVYVDTVRYSMIAYCLGAYWLSRTYSELLFIMIGLTTAITHMFVSTSDEKYVLVERKDFVYGFLMAVGAWLFTKVFLFMAW